MTPRRTAVALLLAAAAAAPAKPAHLALADRMAADVRPADNGYANGPFTVTWAGIDGATTTVNKSDCTTFVTALLRTAYRFTPGEFDAWFGKSSPSVARYYDAAVADSGLHGFRQVADLRPGDLLISKYAAGTATAAGHMMIADGNPVLAKTIAGQKAYDLAVIDCTGSPHAADTRVTAKLPGEAHHAGVGRGTVRFYTDAHGVLQTWAWSSGNGVKVYDPAARPITFAKVPPANVGGR